MPVPYGFTVDRSLRALYYSDGQQRPVLIGTEIYEESSTARKAAGQDFRRQRQPAPGLGPLEAPRASMPGMMDTILNLGLNDDAVEAWPRKTGNERFAWDSLPPLHPDVRRRRHGLKPCRRRTTTRSKSIIDMVKETQGRQARHRARRRRPARSSSRASRR
ncbi:MAG: hypothetical protein MZW92_02435 [Comamonadaceae bacterium]|nr:hypothetical protein [Comamonadaceae bacterium]